MRSLIVALAVFLSACNLGRDAEAERYVNQDMAVPMARLADAMHAMSLLSERDVAKPDIIARLMHISTTLRVFIEETRQVTPAKEFANLHGVLIGYAEDFKSELDRMAVAASKADTAAFGLGCKNLTIGKRGFVSWERGFDQLLTAAGVEQAPLPAAPPVTDDPAPVISPAVPAGPNKKAARRSTARPRSGINVGTGTTSAQGPDSAGVRFADNRYLAKSSAIAHRLGAGKFCPPLHHARKRRSSLREAGTRTGLEEISPPASEVLSHQRACDPAPRIDLEADRRRDPPSQEVARAPR